MANAIGAVGRPCFPLGLAPPPGPFWRAVAQPRDQRGVTSPGPARIRPGVEPRCRLVIAMAEQLAHMLVSAGVVVERDLSAEVPELMRGHVNANVAQYGLLDRNPQGCDGPWCAVPRDE